MTVWQWAKHAQCQLPETKAAKCHSAIIYFIIVACAMLFLLWHVIWACESKSRPPERMCHREWRFFFSIIKTVDYSSVSLWLTNTSRSTLSIQYMQFLLRRFIFLPSSPYHPHLCLLLLCMSPGSRWSVRASLLGAKPVNQWSQPISRTQFKTLTSISISHFCESILRACTHLKNLINYDSLNCGCHT